MQHPHLPDSFRTMNRKWFRLSFPLFLVIVAAAFASVIAAQPETILRLIQFDAGEFPLLKLSFFAADSALSPISDLSGVELVENGTVIEDFTIDRVPVGVELFVIIDGNISMLQTDSGSELSRRELVRNSIVRYATEFMSGEQQDLMHILAPIGGQAEFLALGATTATETSQAISDYNPESLPDLAPLASMIDMALAQAGTEASGNRHQAMLLYTDGGSLDNLLAFSDIVNQAEVLSMPIYAAIVGAVADETEVGNVRQLTQPTRGFHVHLQTPLDSDPIFTAIQAHATQPQLSYRSKINENGDYQVVLSLNEAAITGTFNVRLQRPRITLVTDESVPIQRFGAAHTTPLEQLEPAQTTILAQVDWQDRYPRRIAEIHLRVNGEIVTPLDTPTMDATGQIALEWAIGALRPGQYDISVEIVDELGLTAVTDPLPFRIELVRPTPVPVTPTPPPAPAQEVVAPPAEKLPLAWVSLIVFAVLLLATGVYLTWQNWRRSRAIVIPPGLDSYRGDESGTTFSSLPDGTDGSAAQAPSNAYLEMMGTESGAKRYPVPAHGATLGRDQKLVDIPLVNASVSRLHASIQRRGDSYWLYDEGSASGTYLNFQRVGLTPKSLADRDEIHIGRVHLRFRIETDQEQADDRDSV